MSVPVVTDRVSAADVVASGVVLRPRLGPVTELEGVGPARAAALRALGVFDVGDLLFVMPIALLQGAAPVPVVELLRGNVSRADEVTIEGRVERTSLQRFGRRSTLRVTVNDGTGSIPALFFNQPWLRKRFPVDAHVILRGRLVDQKGPALASPDIGSPEKPLPGAGQCVPVYPAAEGVSAERVGELVRTALARLTSPIVDPIDARALAEFGLPHLDAAVRAVHAPTDAAAYAAARRRFLLEGLLELAARLQERRARAATGRALRVTADDEVDREILARFPWPFTAAQARVARELRADLGRAQPMRRLLQGDVGSGKTALGAYAAMWVARAGGQTAFLAPTELLAEQHAQGTRALFERAGLRTTLLTGSLRAAERRDVLGRIARGDVDVVFGTHALFGAEVVYRRLGLCVFDEQHRFGVAQRAELLEKGRPGGADEDRSREPDVHALLLTATPIPRTLALSLYGDLETSLLDERPPGRGPLRTKWVRGVDKRKVERFLVERAEAGERIYWVVPRIGGDDDGGEGAANEVSAEARFERLAHSELAPFGLDLVHGRVPGEERARRIERFRGGETRVLVATTVIEVGVDVPEATVMVVEGAERLGLAQLHQLRGRVGRGARDSWCFLFGAPTARERFETLERTHDGFVIAEEDLRQRGMGDFNGLRQAGLNSEGLADLGGDIELFRFARDVVARQPAVFEFHRARARAHPAAHAP